MRHSSDHSRLANVAEVTPLNRRPPYRGTMGNLDFWRRFLAPIVFVAALLLVLGVLALRDIRAGDQFDVVRWERTTLANKWLHALGEPFRDDFDDDEALRRYFTLGDRGGDEARELESAVEAAIEGRIDRVLADLGVDGRFPLPASVFPPVDIEIAGSPRVLVISPRSRIERVSSDLLRPDLTQDDFEAIEREAEEDESFAALVVGTGGVATYPAVVAEGRSYRQTLETAAHEWVHHYLVFYPLGRNFYDSSDLQTINETVADVVGDEVAAIILERWGDPTVRPRPTPTTSAPTPEPEVQTSPEPPPVDRNAVLRELRLEVDDLLAAGRIEQAEARMEEVRRELCDGGFCLRRINQAHFAWFGTYAARADATDPIGPQIVELRELSGSLSAFLEAVRDAGSRQDIEALVGVDEGG